MSTTGPSGEDRTFACMDSDLGYGRGHAHGILHGVRGDEDSYAEMTQRDRGSRDDAIDMQGSHHLQAIQV